MPKRLIFRFIGASVISAILLSISWPTSMATFFIFIAFVPYLWISDQVDKVGFKKPGRVFWWCTWLMMLLWNICTTWWVWNASEGGAVTAIIANSLLMTLPFSLFRYVKRISNEKFAQIALVLSWITFEYVHLNWDLSWPWITLGNVFAAKTSWIQWYEFTGVLGGSAWVWMVNLAVWNMIHARIYAPNKFVVGKVIWTLCTISIPLITSFVIESNFESKGPKSTVVVVQPNIDPYEEKFVHGQHFIPYATQIKNILDQSAPYVDSTTSLLLWPETAIQGMRWEDQLKYDQDLAQIYSFMDSKPNLALLTGIESVGKYDSVSAPKTARYHPQIGFYDHYNTGMFLYDKSIQLYHKSKLVPGVELLPFPEVLGFVLEIIDFDGASNYGKQDERPVYEGKNGLKVIPVICYESIYGEFVGKYVQNRGNLICIITNDGWWGNTQGHKQHQMYAKLRAIEHRKYVVRSANTGISSVINDKGEVVQETKWWVKDVLKASITQNPQVTFYARYGDYIGRLSVFILSLMMVSVLVKSKTMRTKKTSKS